MVWPNESFCQLIPSAMDDMQVLPFWQRLSVLNDLFTTRSDSRQVHRRWTFRCCWQSGVFGHKKAARSFYQADLQRFSSINSPFHRHFTSLFKFRAHADKRHCSVTRSMPLLRVRVRLWFAFWCEKFPSHHIFRSRMAARYSGVPIFFRWIDLAFSCSVRSIIRGFFVCPLHCSLYGQDKQSAFFAVYLFRLSFFLYPE